MVRPAPVLVEQAPPYVTAQPLPLMLQPGGDPHPRDPPPPHVIPAKAGISFARNSVPIQEIPACAGMTAWRGVEGGRGCHR